VWNLKSIAFLFLLLDEQQRRKKSNSETDLKLWRSRCLLNFIRHERKGGGVAPSFESLRTVTPEKRTVVIRTGFLWYRIPYQLLKGDLAVSTDFPQGSRLGCFTVRWVEISS
jgi:hypothetical protein